ncbi:MAG: hypothetical protein HYZ71_05355 [Deltaproteobacteria bacterium]|nr:hypothetical protein [Deltaproteobacteria bacterium]
MSIGLNLKSGALFILVLSLSGVTTEIIRLLCRRIGFVSRPVSNRWSTRTVPLGGGIGIAFGLIVGLAWIDLSLFLKIGPAVFLVFALGLFDDYKGVSPGGKLVIQTIAACYVVGNGLVLPIPWPVLSIPITVLWIVGISNAINLIDNMDGLAGGIVLIAAISLAALLTLDPTNAPYATLSLIVAGLIGGFLIHNFYPARIFMGDSGSLPLGFLLALLSARVRVAGQPNSLLLLAPIAMVLLVPIFDIVLVVVARSTASRPLMLGGRDHSSHRLVGMGLSEPRAVCVLYLIGLLGSMASLYLVNASSEVTLLVTIVVAVVSTLFGFFLLETVVYPPAPQKDPSIPTGFRAWFSGPKNLPIPMLYVVEVAIDICIVTFTWTLAHVIRFNEAGELNYYRTSSVIPTLPFLIAVKLSCFTLFRLYRGFWQNAQGRDAYNVFKAVTLSSLLLIAGSALSTRLQDLSRIVILLDWSLTFMAITGARTAIGSFRRWFGRLAIQPFRAALVGPPHLAPLVTEALKRESGINFAGVISTERAPENEAILGMADRLEAVVSEKEIDILFVATSDFHEQLNYLAAKGIMVRPVRLQLS